MFGSEHLPMKGDAGKHPKPMRKMWRRTRPRMTGKVVDKEGGQEDNLNVVQTVTIVLQQI